MKTKKDIGEKTKEAYQKAATAVNKLAESLNLLKKNRKLTIPKSQFHK